MSDMIPVPVHQALRMEAALNHGRPVHDRLMRIADQAEGCHRKANETTEALRELLGVVRRMDGGASLDPQSEEGYQAAVDRADAALRAASGGAA